MSNSSEFAAPVPATAPQPKRRRIPRIIHRAIDLIATGRVKTIQSAADRIGWERTRLTKWLHRPEVIEAMKTRAAKEVALGSGRAAARLAELMESPSAKVAMEATKFSLQAAGIGPATAAPVNVNVEFRAGYVIDLSGRNPPGPLQQRIFPGVGAVIEPKVIESKVETETEPGERIRGIGPDHKPADVESE